MGGAVSSHGVRLVGRRDCVCGVNRDSVGGGVTDVVV